MSPPRRHAFTPISPFHGDTDRLRDAREGSARLRDAIHRYFLKRRADAPYRPDG